MSLPHVKVHNANIFYKTWETSNRNAPWLYLVNGHTRSHADFNFFAKFLVENGINVISHDNRGCGQTTNTGPIDLNEMTLDIKSVVDVAELQSNRISILGLSMGGVLAQKFCAAYPGLFEKLVLISTCPKAQPWMMKYEGLWPNDINQIVLRLNKYFSRTFQEKNAILIKAMAKNVLEQVERNNFIAKAEDQRLAMKGFDLTPILAKITLPTLIVHGDEDEVIEVGAAKFLHEKIPNSTLKIYPGAGHLLIAELGKTLYRDVLNFLQYQ